MDDPVPGRLLPQLLLHQRVLVSEQFHGQFVVRRLEKRDDLVFEVGGPRGGERGRRRGLLQRGHLFLRGAVQTDVIAYELDVAFSLVVVLRVEIVGDDGVGVVVHGDGDGRVDFARTRRWRRLAVAF